MSGWRRAGRALLLLVAMVLQTACASRVLPVRDAVLAQLPATYTAAEALGVATGEVVIVLSGLIWALIYFVRRD